MQNEEITYEIFRDKVVNWLEPMLKLNRQEVEKYVDSEEEEVRSRFEVYKEAHDNGELTAEMFLGSCVGSVGFCLYMMY